VDWISGVGESLQITSATIHHCVLMMDLYTSLQQNVLTQDLQLISVTCLMISTKFHEMKYPSASSLNSATRNAYSYDIIIAKEGEILATLNWELLRYTVLDYVHVFIN
jgi:Cyclin, N-terminal domain